MLSQISHHLEAVDLFGSDDSCQGLIWPNHPSVERVLEVVVPDVVPGQPHNLTHGGSLHTDDCHQVLVNLQLSSQVGEPPSSPDSSSLLSSLHFVIFLRHKISEHLLACLELWKQ